MSSIRYTPSPHCRVLVRQRRGIISRTLFMTIGVVLLMFVVGYGAYYFYLMREIPTPTRSSRPTVGEPKPPKREIDLIALRKQLRDFREENGGGPKLDRRIQLACGELHHWLTGEPFAEAAVEWVKDHWRITHGDVEVGVLPPNWRIAQAKELLFQWIERCNQKDWPAGDPIKGSPKLFHAPHLLHAIEASQSDLMVRPSKALLSHLAGLMSRLALHSLNNRICDVLQSRAWALVLLEEKITNQPNFEHECCSAIGLNYFGHAERCAQKLPDPHPLRLYFAKRIDQLGEQASTNPLAAKLLSLHYAANRDFDRWEQNKADHLADGLAARLSGLEELAYFDDFAQLTQIARILMAGVVQEIEIGGYTRLGDPTMFLEAADPLAGSVEEQWRNCDYFESRLATSAVNGDGPLIDATLTQRYYQRIYYLSQQFSYRQARGLSSPEHIDRFIQQLGDRGAGPFAKEMQDSVRIRIDTARKHSYDVDPLFKVTHYFWGDLFEMYAYEDRDGYYFMSNRYAMNLLRILDDRCSFFNQLAQLLQTVRHDDVMDQLFDRADDVFVQAERPTLAVLRWQNKNAEIAALAQTALDKADGSVMELNQLVAGGDLKGDDLAKAYDRVLEKGESKSLNIRNVAQFYWKRGERDKAKGLLRNWIREHGETKGFEGLFAQNLLTHYYYLDKKYDEALPMAEAAAESWQGGSIANLIRILMRLGRTEEALQWADNLVNRYPQLTSKVTKAQVLWEMGRIKEGTEQMVGHTFNDWNVQIVDAMEWAFGDDDDKAVEMYRWFCVQPWPEMVKKTLVDTISNRNKKEWAIRMYDYFLVNVAQQPQVVFSRYKETVAHDGKDAALTWLRPWLSSMQSALAPIAFQFYDWDFLWDQFDDMAPEANDDKLWLYRTMSILDPKHDQPERKQRVLEHYANTTKPKNFRAACALHLLGKLDDDDTLQSVYSKPDAEELCYLLAVAHELRGDLVGAAFWCRMTCLSDQRILNPSPFPNHAGRKLQFWQKRQRHLGHVRHANAVDE